MDNYFNELKIVVLDNAYAKNFMEIHHYTHSCGKCVIAYGIYHHTDLKCVVAYGYPSGRNLASSIWEGGNEQECLELIRLFSFDDCPKNMESWCISKSVKCLKRDLPNIKVLVSYADTGAGHVGYIYQASSWDYIGQGSKEPKIFIDGQRVHRRSLNGKYGTSSIKKLKEIFGDRLQVDDNRFAKNKYIKIIKDKNKIEKLLKVKKLPYPKGDIKYYNDTNNEFNSINGMAITNKKHKEIDEQLTFLDI